MLPVYFIWLNLTLSIAQMNRAMSVARNLLKDITPPIPDNEIADSVWHYWFDGQKAAAWLRQDREKKG